MSTEDLSSVRRLTDDEILQLWREGKLRVIDPSADFPKFAVVSRCWCEESECVGAGNLPIDEFCGELRGEHR